MARFHTVTEDLPRGFKPRVPSLLMLEILKSHREKPLSGMCEICHTDACPAFSVILVPLRGYFT